MDSKVFIARIPDEPYMEISSGGSFINPITATFSLRDTKVYKYVVQPLYIIILNSSLGFVQLESTGSIPGFDLKVSWVNDEDTFAFKINKEVSIDATNTKESIPFYIQYKVLDDLDIATRDQYSNIVKIKLVWA